MDVAPSDEKDLIDSIKYLTPEYQLTSLLLSLFQTTRTLYDWPIDNTSAIPEWVKAQLEKLITLLHQKKRCHHNMQSLLNTFNTSTIIESDEGPIQVIPFRWNYQIVLFKHTKGDFNQAIQQMQDFLNQLSYPPLCILVLYPESQPKPKINQQIQKMPFGYRFIPYDITNPTIPAPDFGSIRSIVFGTPHLDLFKTSLNEIYPSVEWVRDQLISLRKKTPQSNNQPQEMDKENHDPIAKRRRLAILC